LESAKRFSFKVPDGLYSWHFSKRIDEKIYESLFLSRYVFVGEKDTLEFQSELGMADTGGE